MDRSIKIIPLGVINVVKVSTYVFDKMSNA